MTITDDIRLEFKDEEPRIRHLAKSEQVKIVFKPNENAPIIMPSKKIDHVRDQMLSYDYKVQTTATRKNVKIIFKDDGSAPEIIPQLSPRFLVYSFPLQKIKRRRRKGNENKN